MNTKNKLPISLNPICPYGKLFIPQQMKLAFTQGQENGEVNPDKSQQG